MVAMLLAHVNVVSHTEEKEEGGTASVRMRKCPGKKFLTAPKNKHHWFPRRFQVKPPVCSKHRAIWWKDV